MAAQSDGDHNGTTQADWMGDAGQEGVSGTGQSQWRDDGGGRWSAVVSVQAS